MSEREQIVSHDMHASTERGTLVSYVTGFVLSLVLTAWAYVSVVRHTFSGNVLIGWLLLLAIVQFFVQLFFFLHFGHETKPRWKLLTLTLMFVVVLIVVLGSIWIMYNLNYRMDPTQVNEYMRQQAGEGF